MNHKSHFEKEVTITVIIITLYNGSGMLKAPVKL